MSQWPSSKTKRVLAALVKLGWQLKRQSGSHRTLSRAGWPDFVFAFHDSEEVGPRMLARILQSTPIFVPKICSMVPRVTSNWLFHPTAYRIG